MADALAGIKVLELGHMVAAPYCAKIMADMGADVVKAEPPEGDPARARGPFYKDLPDRETSALYLYLNTNKRGVTLNPSTATGRSILKDLLAQVDVFVEDTMPGTLEGWGLGFPALKRLNPRLIVASITPFGQTGPYRHYRAYDLNLFHGGGQGHMVRNDALGARPPLTGGGYLAEFDGGMTAAVAVLGALYHQGLTGQGQRLDCSIQEAVMALERAVLTRYPNELFGSATTPLGSRNARSGMSGVQRCQDGWVVIAALEEHQWQGLLRLIGAPDGSARSSPELETHIRNWLAEHTMDEVYHGAEALSVPAGRLQTSKDLLASEQLRAREFFQAVAHPSTGPLPYPTASYRMSASPWRARRPAPLLGQHNAEVYCGWLGWGREELGRLAEAGVI
ncbi:MAG: CoA transferase [Chloroflexi bacterium]|nr:CoA transferase [Chloroflexota bacterium]